jgi:hypothetical protein
MQVKVTTFNFHQTAINVGETAQMPSFHTLNQGRILLLLNFFLCFSPSILLLMAVFNSPRSFQNVNTIAQAPMGVNSFFISAHESHPPFLQLVLLVFSAVLEVVCVSLPGYIAARQGMFDADAQKLVANLNVTLFTPCLSMDCSTLFL